MNWKKLLELFSNISAEDRRDIKRIANKEFLKSISDNNIEQIKEALTRGLDVTLTSFWKDLHNLGYKGINHETYRFLLNTSLTKTKIDNKMKNNFSPELRELMTNDKNSKIDLDILIKEVLKEKILKKIVLDADNFNEDIFFLANDYIEKDKINKNIIQVIRNIGKGDISKYSDKLNKYITQNNLVIHLLEGIYEPKFLNYLFNNKIYSQYFRDASDDIRGDVMDYALSNAQIEKVKLLNKLGISLFNNPKKSKSAYSLLFMMNTNDGQDTQDFVVRNIKELSIGNHVILKTLLHVKTQTIDHQHKLNLLNNLLERYSDKQMNSIPSILDKREKTKRVLFVEQYYNTRLFKIELSNELEATAVNHISVKKLKV